MDKALLGSDWFSDPQGVPVSSGALTITRAHHRGKGVIYTMDRDLEENVVFRPCCYKISK